MSNRQSWARSSEDWDDDDDDGEDDDEEEEPEDASLAWSEPEWTCLHDVPDGYQAWISRADLPDASDASIGAARASIQRLLDIWLEAYPDAGVQPRPRHVHHIVAALVDDLRDVIRALDLFLIDAPRQDTCALPYVRAWVRNRAIIFWTHAAGTDHADTYCMALEDLHQVYPPCVGFKIRPGKYKGNVAIF